MKNKNSFISLTVTESKTVKTVFIFIKYVLIQLQESYRLSLFLLQQNKFPILKEEECEVSYNKDQNGFPVQFVNDVDIVIVMIK